MFQLCKKIVFVDVGHMEEITGSIVAEIDVPTNSTRVVASLDICGSVGAAKLHIPKEIAVTFLAVFVINVITQCSF